MLEGFSLLSYSEIVNGPEVLVDHQAGLISLQGNDPESAGYIPWGSFQNNLADIRFTYINPVGLEETVLNHWRVSCDNGAKTATFYVKAPILAANTNHAAYVYGNNPEAPDISNYSATMTKITDTTSQGCQGLWHMDDGSGDDIIDSSGNNYHGTRIGATKPVWQGNDGGQWDGENYQFDTGDHLYFNGSNYVSMGDVLDIGTSDFSVEMWVYRPSGASGRLVCKEYDDYGWWIHVNTNGLGELRAGIRVSGHNIIVGLGAPITANSWHHVVWAVDRSDRMYLYINCILNDTQDISSYVSADISNVNNLHIGHRDFYNDLFFTGYIDEVAIYNRVLSSEEAQAHCYRRKYADTQPAWGIGEGVQKFQAEAEIRKEASSELISILSAASDVRKNIAASLVSPVNGISEVRKEAIGYLAVPLSALAEVRKDALAVLISPVAGISEVRKEALSELISIKSALAEVRKDAEAYKRLLTYLAVVSTCKKFPNKTILVQ